MKAYSYVSRFIVRNLSQTMTFAFLIFTLQVSIFSQISSYTDVGESGGSAVGYGAVSGGYPSGFHVSSTHVNLSGPSGSASASGGDSATAYLSVTEDGYYGANTTHEGTCPYSGGTHTVGGSGGGQTIYVDTCTPCQVERSSKRLICIGIASTCESAAAVVYNSAMTACENNNFCNPNSPQYNQQQCDNCKDTANQNFAIATGACTAALVICLEATLPDCTSKIRADGSACSNN